MRVGAYIVSISLCKKQMAKMFQPLKSLQISEAILELNTLISVLNDEKLNKIHGLNNEDVWDTSFSKV